jgi:hypothetical protein
MIPIPLGGPLGVAAAPGHMALPEAIAGVPANATAAVAISKMRIFRISFVVVLASPAVSRHLERDRIFGLIKARRNEIEGGASTPVRHSGASPAATMSAKARFHGLRPDLAPAWHHARGS